MKSAKKKVTANPKSVPTDTLKNVEPKEFASMEMTVPINIKKENNHSSDSTVNKEVTLKHDADICAMKKELHQLKVLIMQLANQVELLN